MGYQAGGYYPGYGYSQPPYSYPQTQYYGGYPYQPSGYAPNYYNYGQPNYSGYYPGYGYSQPQYYGYPYRQPSYNELFGNPYGGYQPNGYYGGYSYFQSPSQQYLTADVDVWLDEGDNGAEITLEEGEILCITLPSTETPSGRIQWEIDTNDLDTDVVKIKSSINVITGLEQFIFEAKDVGTTIIKIDNTSWMNNIGYDTFEVEITVED